MRKYGNNDGSVIGPIVDMKEKSGKEEKSEEKEPEKKDEEAK